MKLPAIQRGLPLLLASLLIATSLLTGCAQPTATPLPPVTVVKPVANAPTAAQPVPPTAAQPVAPTAYVGPPTSSAPSAPPVAYPEPTIPEVAPQSDGPGFTVTVLHVNDVYGEIDPCG